MKIFKGIIIVLFVTNFSYAEIFKTDTWLEKVKASMQNSQIVNDIRNKYGSISISQIYNSSEQLLEISIEITKDLLSLNSGEPFIYYGAVQFSQLDLEKLYSSLWYSAKNVSIFMDGKQATIPGTYIKKIRFIIDARNMVINDIEKIPEYRKSVKKKIFEYVPIEGISNDGIYGLSTVNEYIKEVQE